jgi:hypothetical protein
LALSSISFPRAVLCPYIRLVYEQVWNEKEVCLGPIRSVMGLAPGESIVTEFSQVEQVSFSQLVRRGFETSETTSFSVPTHEVDGSRPVGGSGRGTWDIIHDVMQNNTGVAGPLGGPIVLRPCVVTGFGSLNFGGILGAAAGALVGGPIGAAVGAWLGNAVGEMIGGSGEAQVSDAVDQNLASISRTQTEYSSTETLRARTTTTERSISRAFTNPYRDRGMDLRFLPVYRHYEVVTSLIRIEVGLSCIFDPPRFQQGPLSSKFGPLFDIRLLDPRIRALVELDLGVEPPPPPGVGWRTGRAPNRPKLLLEHLNANAERYGKVAVADALRKGDAAEFMDQIAQMLPDDAKKGREIVEAPLAWHSAYSLENAVFIPIPDVKQLNKWQGFKDAHLGRLTDFAPFKPNAAPIPLGHRVKNVHVYLGTRIEAAPADCVLPNLPA